MYWDLSGRIVGYICKLSEDFLEEDKSINSKGIIVNLPPSKTIVETEQGTDL